MDRRPIWFVFIEINRIQTALKTNFDLNVKN